MVRAVGVDDAVVGRPGQSRHRRARNRRASIGWLPSLELATDLRAAVAVIDRHAEVRAVRRERDRGCRGARAGRGHCRRGNVDERSRSRTAACDAFRRGGRRIADGVERPRGAEVAVAPGVTSAPAAGSMPAVLTTEPSGAKSSDPPAPFAHRGPTGMSVGVARLGRRRRRRGPEGDGDRRGRRGARTTSGSRLCAMRHGVRRVRRSR